MKSLFLRKKYYYVFYNKSFRRGGQECRGFYYKNENENLYFRFATFKTGNLIALVSSQHSSKKIKKLLSKPKPLLINRCCGFKVLETEFQSVAQDFSKHHFQISHNKGKTYFDYHKGAREDVDSLFENADVCCRQYSDWNVNDFAEILEPHFGIKEVTNEYKSGTFQLKGYKP